MKNNGIFLERLIECRKESGYSMAKMAELLGYNSAMSYSYIEKGITNLSVDRMKKLAQIFGKEVGYFFDLNIQETCTELDKE